MKMTRSKKSLSLFLCIVLIAAIALFTTGCNDNTIETPEQGTNQETESITESVSITDADTAETVELGEGTVSFVFTVTDADGNESNFLINTDKTTVGEALIEHDLIAGEEGPYGLYVKTVNGKTYDYDKDGKYWAFYVNGEYGSTGVDLTDIAEGTTYSFKAE